MNLNECKRQLKQILSQCQRFNNEERQYIEECDWGDNSLDFLKYYGMTHYVRVSSGSIVLGVYLRDQSNFPDLTKAVRSSLPSANDNRFFGVGVARAQEDTVDDIIYSFPNGLRVKVGRGQNNGLKIYDIEFKIDWGKLVEFDDATKQEISTHYEQYVWPSLDTNRNLVGKLCRHNARSNDQVGNQLIANVNVPENRMNIEDQITKQLLSAGQIILHGAPGTGKTYLAKKVAMAMLGKDYTQENWAEAFKAGRVGFCQFHPSYDYSDFVEGLRPTQGADGQVGFKRMDGVFKKMCKDAIAASRSGGVDNFDESWKKFVDDLTERNSQDNPLEIKTDSTMFKVFLNSRNNLSLITSGTDKVQGTLTKAKIRGYYIANPEQDYWACYYKGVLEYLTRNCDLKPYQQGHEIGADTSPRFVFIIDEINRGDISKIFGELFFSIDPGYRGKKGLVKTQYQNLVEPRDVFEEGFYVPENVYIIGTMNDIDRSVESMDFAIRRRFVWKEVPADPEVLDSNDARKEIPDDRVREKAASLMKALNNEVVEELGSEYAIGPAYFFKLPKLQNDFSKLWDMNLKPLLREYLRGNSKDEITAKMKKFENAYFESLPETQKRDDKLNAADQNGKDASGVSAG